MICPNCKKEISFVRIYSECWQKGYLDGDSKTVISYGSVEEITEAIGIECPECGHDLEPLVERT
jgi:DNA-directed RNA polymerase subunit RPC12/RpoP